MSGEFKKEEMPDLKASEELKKSSGGTNVIPEKSVIKYVGEHRAITKKNILIVGAGVLGLSIGEKLAKRGHRVKIIAKDDRSASRVAPAIGKPFGVEGDPKATELAKKSLPLFEQQAAAPKVGIHFNECVVVLPKEATYPSWRNFVPDFKELSSEEIKSRKFPPHVRKAFTFNMLIIETGFYLRYLRDEFQKHGGVYQFTGHRVESFQERALWEGNDVVVNCTGGLDRALIGDDARNMVGVRGQLLKIAYRPDLPALVDDIGPDTQSSLTNIVPKPMEEVTVLEGEVSVGDESTEIREKVTHGILERIRAFGVNVSEKDIKGIDVGVRPVRTGGVRIETENIGNGKSRKLVHVYGAGAVGVSTAPAIAEEGVALIEE